MQTFGSRCLCETIERSSQKRVYLVAIYLCLAMLEALASSMYHTVTAVEKGFLALLSDWPTPNDPSYAEFLLRYERPLYFF